MFPLRLLALWELLKQNCFHLFTIASHDNKDKHKLTLQTFYQSIQTKLTDSLWT